MLRRRHQRFSCGQAPLVLADPQRQAGGEQHGGAGGDRCERDEHDAAYREALHSAPRENVAASP
jgi:hypothetical protein